MSDESNLADTLNHAPELQTAPDLAVAASRSNDPIGTGRALAHTVHAHARDKAVENVSKHTGHPNFLHQTLGFFDHNISKAYNTVDDTIDKIPGGKLGKDLGIQVATGFSGGLGGLKKIGGEAMDLSNRSLVEVQHIYRAYHDIEARHGTSMALLEMLGIAAAGAAAAATAIPSGGSSLAIFGGTTAAIIGGEVAADVASRSLYPDSWERTADGEAYRGRYNRQTGKYSGGPVSLGRDVVDHLPNQLNWARFMSGPIDGLADLTFDPLQQVGMAFGTARKAAITVSTVDGLDEALRNPLTSGALRRAFGNIASIDSATEIGRRYPKFQAVAKELAGLHSEEAVTEWFRSTIGTAEFMDRFPGELPLLPLTRIPFKEAQEFLRTSPITKVFTLLPTDFDPELHMFSNEEFDPAGQRWMQGAYRTLRYGQTHQVAQEYVDTMAAVGVDERRSLWRNALASLGISQGIAEDSDWYRHYVQEIENSTPLLGGPEAVFATDATGRNLSLLPNEFGDRASAVLENQTGKWAFPDYAEFVRAKRARNGLMNVIGSIDDGFYQHFTQPIFKTGALLTAGFGQRIGAAEGVMTVARQGFLRTVKNSIEQHVGRYALTDAEAEGRDIAAAVQHMVGGAAKLAKADPEDIDLFTRAVMDNGGHLVARGLDADAHGAAGISFLDVPEGNATTLLQRLFKKVPPNRRFGDSFGIFGVSPGHAETWQVAAREMADSELGQTAAKTLQRELANGRTLDEATRSATNSVRNLLDSKPEEWLSRFERHRVSSTPGVAPHEDWGRVVTEYVKGLAGSPNQEGLIHDRLLARLAKGEVPSLEELEAVQPVHRPLVKGRIEAPVIWEGPMKRIAQVGFTKFIDPIVNFLGREPLYAMELKRHYNALRPLIEDGVLSEADALRITQNRVVLAATPFIHNPMERSQFAVLARNFMPFYFAQTQAYRRVGRLLADNPGAFRKYQLAAMALHDLATVIVGDDGEKQAVYPGAGLLGTGTVAALGALGIEVAGSTPVAFSGDIRSLGTVFPIGEDSGGIGVGPFTAKLGPIVSIPVHTFEALFPEYGVPVAEKVLGPVGASQGLIDQFIPNTPLRNTLKAAGILPGGDRAVTSTSIQIIQSLAFQQEQAMARWVKAGHQPSDDGHPTFVPLASDGPQVKQRFIDRVRNQARILLFVKAGLSAVAPMSPRLTANDLGLSAEVSKLINKPGPDGKPLGLGGAITEFLRRHPDATPYTVFGSAADVNGAYLPANKSAQKFIDDYLGVLRKYPDAGVWLVPQTSEPFSQAVYQEQLVMALRHKKAPKEFLDDIYIAQGNNQFFNKDYPEFQEQLANVQGDREAERQLRSEWNTYLSKELGALNPVWWDHFQSKDREHQRDRSIDQLIQIFQNGDAPPGPQTKAVKSLLDDYQDYNAQKIAGRQDSWSKAQRDELQGQWRTYMDELSKSKPELAPIINKLFRSL